MHSGAFAVESFAVASAEKLYISSNGDIVEGWCFVIDSKTYQLKKII